MLPKEAILEYQEIYRNQYGIKLTFEEASEYANKLFNFVELITTSSENKQ